MDGNINSVLLDLASKLGSSSSERSCFDVVDKICLILIAVPLRVSIPCSMLEWQKRILVTVMAIVLISYGQHSQGDPIFLSETNSA